jgi:hypothetical protein
MVPCETSSAVFHCGFNPSGNFHAISNVTRLDQGVTKSHIFATVLNPLPSHSAMSVIFLTGARLNLLQIIIDSSSHSANTADESQMECPDERKDVLACEFVLIHESVEKLTGG